MKILTLLILSVSIFGCASMNTKQNEQVMCTPANDRAPAESIQPGVYEVGVDWERIERGIKTGDFSCHGTCAQISIDWKEVWRTVSGKNYRDRRKADLQYCISSYSADKKAREDVAAAVKLNDGQVNERDAQILNQQRDIILRSIDRTCSELIGTDQRNKIKSEIYGH